MLYFGLSLLPSDEVGTAFANEIVSTIPAEEWQPARLHSARWISLCALVFLLSACYEFLFCVWLTLRCCVFGVTSCCFIDFTLALLLKTHLRFCGSFCAFTAWPTAHNSDEFLQMFCFWYLYVTSGQQDRCKPCLATRHLTWRINLSHHRKLRSVKVISQYTSISWCRWTRATHYVVRIVMYTEVDAQRDKLANVTQQTVQGLPSSAVWLGPESSTLIGF